MIDAESLYFGRLEAKIDNATRLFLEHEARLRADPDVSSSLNELRVRLDALDVAMGGAGFPALCSACAATEPGGCCDVTIAEEAYGLLLLVNLLLGVSLQRQVDLPGCCTFVGPNGCTLRPKPLICWNYNCRHIHQTLLRPDVAGVEHLVGRALQQLLLTEEAIKQRLALGNPTEPIRPAA